MLVWDIGSALGCVLLPRICIERIGGEGERVELDHNATCACDSLVTPDQVLRDVAAQG